MIKKLHRNEKAALDKAIKAIMKDPKIGEAKEGDLAGVFVYRFKVKDRKWLLAYELISSREIRLLLVGPHENYYRDLKRNTRS